MHTLTDRRRPLGGVQVAPGDRLVLARDPVRRYQTLELHHHALYCTILRYHAPSHTILHYSTL